MKKIFFLAIFLFCFLNTPVFGSDERALFEKGVQYLKQQQYPEAIASFTALIESDPHNPDAYKNRGVAHMKNNQYDLAIRDFEKTRDLVPDLKGLYSNLGVAWYYKAQYTKAIENYNKEISLSPDSHYTYFNRAICWAELDEYDKSLADISKTLSLKPDFYLAHCLKGDLLLKTNNLQAARKAYERAIEIDPEQMYARTQLEKMVPAPQPPPETDTAGFSTNSVTKQMPGFSKTSRDPEIIEKQSRINGPGDVEEALPSQKKPSQKKTSSTVPALIEKPAGEKRDEGYEIQTGAYQVKANAQQMYEKLMEKGYEARILVLTRPSKITWYMVRTGTYPDRKQAEQTKERFIHDTGMDAVVRPRDRF